MALRAVSIVNLEGSIRAQFDRQIDEIQRTDLQGRQQEGNESTRREESSGEEAPSVPDTNNNAPESGTTTEEILGESAAPGTRSHSVDIRVEYDAFPESPEQDDNQSETSDRELENETQNRERQMTCCQFYRRHWVGHLVTGVLSGCLFVLLGIIFLVNGNQFPVYAGIILLILGLAPCCMALNRYRYARIYERERRRALRRLNALRRQHRRATREERRRRRQQFSDLPPSYDNLAFDLNLEDFDITDRESIVTISSRGSFVLPTYDQCVKKEDETSVKDHPRIQEIHDETARERESHNTDNNTTENLGEIDESNLVSRERQVTSDVQIEITEPVVEIQIIENHFDETADSVVPSSGDATNEKYSTESDTESDLDSLSVHL